MSTHSVSVEETLTMSDSTKVELELDAVIYRNAFKAYEAAYAKSRKDEDLALGFILLQVYVECFLHQNMRRVVEHECMHTRQSEVLKWYKNERLFVYEKVLPFVTLFFSPTPKSVEGEMATILDNFKRISVLRNTFAHGHKIASWSDSEGNSGSTPAKSLLTEAQLIQTKADVNELGLAWNNLLKEVLPQCRALRSVDSYFFEILD